MTQNKPKHTIFTNIGLYIGITLGYAIAFVFSYPTLGAATGTLEVIPCIIIAWLRGLKAGILYSIFIIIFTPFLYRILNDIPLIDSIDSSYLTGAFATLLFAALIGYSSNLRQAMSQELQAKKEAEIELRLLGSQLESLVNERDKALQTTQENYNLVLQNSPDAIVIVNKQGHIKETNKKVTQLLGFPQDVLQTMSIEALVAPESKGQHRQDFKKIISGKASLFERKLQHQDGSIIETEVSVSLLPNGQILGIIHDISLRKKQEAELFKREAYYRSLFENNDLAITIFTRELILEDINPKAASYFQSSPEQLINSPLDKLFHPSVVDVFFEAINQVFAYGTPMNVESTVQYDNLQIYFLNSLTPVPDESGNIVAVQIVSQDITPLIEIQAALYESELRWQFALEGSGAGVWDWNEETHTVFHSKQWYTMLGYTQDDIAASRENWERLVHPVDWPDVEEELNRHYRGETDVYRCEYRMKCKDGSYKWIASRGKVFARDEAGHPVRMIGTHTDINEQKQIENLILYMAQGVSHASDEQYFWEMVYHLGQGLNPFLAFIGQTNPDNPREVQTLAVYKNGQLSTNFAYNLDHTPCDTVVGHAICVYPTAVYNRFPKDIILVEEQIEGYIGAPLFDSHGKPLGLVAVLFKTPITQPKLVQSLLQVFASRAGAEMERMHAQEALRRSEEHLREAQKIEAIGRLAGGVAHDFNNILTVIISYSDLLLRIHNDPSDKDHRRIRQIKESGERAAAITQQLLAFSRRQVLDPVTLNLNAVVSGMYDMLQHLSGESIQIRIHLASDLGYVRADPGQLEQVLLNLTINARDAIHRNGEITIETQNRTVDEVYAKQYYDVTTGAYVVLSVRDTGSGMDEEVMAQIFEPFFTTKETGKGTGLGLSTVHGIIKQSGGHIHVESELGVGSRFDIYLPQVERPVPVEFAHMVEQTAVTGDETILLVEDEKLVRETTEEILQMHGYTVHTNNGTTAVEMCRQLGGKIDLLLTDVVMPVMSGREIAEQINAEFPHIKVLYMSGYTDNVIIDHGVLKQGIAFIHKPFTPLLLAQKVRTILDGV